MERIIKRYRNRKMYDTVRKEYVNFSDIEKMIRDNETIKVIDNVTGEDITRQTLIQLIMRSEPTDDGEQVSLENLLNVLKNKENPLFQTLNNMLLKGKDMVTHISSRISSADEPEIEELRKKPKHVDQFKGLLEKVTDSTTRLIDGTLAREMLKVPKREDLNRLVKKIELLEQKIKQLKENKTGGQKDAEK